MFKFRKRRIRIAKLFLVPICISLTLIFTFFILDDFYIYVNLLLINNQNGRVSENIDYNYNSNDHSYMQGLVGEVGFTGTGGLSLALINKMAGGYIKDYLEIVRDHANWKYVNESIERRSEYIPINTIIGMSQLETSGITVEYGGRKLVMPQTPLNYDEYNTVDGLNLYTVNSAWFKKNGFKYINRNSTTPSTMQWGDSRSDGGGTAHTTPYQFDMMWFAELPDGNASYGDCSNYPSLLNTGYGYIEGTIRDTTQTDAAYFPDVLSVLIQSSYKRLFDLAELSEINNTELASNMMHIGHHGPGTILDIALGYNSSNVGFASNSPTSSKESFSSMLNIYSEDLQKVFDYFSEHVDSGLEWNWNGRENYLGIGVGMFFASGNAFFKNTGDRDKLVYDFSNNIDFHDGVMLGFEIFSGRTYTEQEIKDILNSPDNLKTDLGGGYPVGNMRYGTGSKVYKYSLYLLDDNVNVIYRGCDGSTVPVIHGWNAITLRMAFLSPLYGTYQMWEMLKASGVDCTYAEVMGINSNNLLNEIPNYGHSGDIGTTIAKCAALLCWEDGVYDGKSWTSKSIAYATWGNSLYIKVHQDINDNPQFRCCDAFVNTAILWSRADTTCTKQGVKSAVRQYFSNSDKWEKIITYKGGTTNPDLSIMKPGDVVIGTSSGGGHIMIYVGDVVSQVYPQYADKIGSYNVAHASYSHVMESKGDGESINSNSKNKDSARSGKLSTMAGNITSGGFEILEVFRCVHPDNTTGQILLTAAEIDYLKNHPFQSQEQYHPSFNPAGNSVARNIQIRTK